jgi:hypothetical protein
MARIHPAALLLLLLGPGTAHAFCRTTTCNAASCERSAAGCVVGGKPLVWVEPCVSFSVQEAGAPRLGLGHTGASELIGQAFARWMDADCGGARPSIAVSGTPEPTRCARAEQNSEGPNANVWIFRNDAWAYARNALAVTIVSYSTTTGAILGADVELNVAAADLTFGEQHIGFDLESVVQHEAGHFLGLSHSDVKQATMWRSIGAGMTDKRALHADDVQAICEAYPPDRPAGVCDFAPRGGWSAECGEPERSEGCRASAPGRSPSWPVAVVLLALLIRRKRRIG